MTTITQLTQDLNMYRSAREKILLGQEYSIGGRSLRRPDLALVEKKIQELEARIAMANNSGKIKSRNVIFG